MSVAPVTRHLSLASEPGTPAMTARGLTKRFGSTLATDEVDLAIFPHEVHALLGENGAGKSTLVKMLYGYLRPDEGEILLGDRRVEFRSPADAKDAGLGMVFQQSTLIPAFTVAENIALYLPRLDPVIDLEAISRHISETSSRYGLKIDPERRAGHLSAGEQQRAEVVKLLVAGARILIFDEPTSLLAEHEIEALFEVFAQLREDGYPVLFITHKLHEVMTESDRITVMRKGRVVGSLETRSTSEPDLVELMFGDSPVASLGRRAEPGTGEPLLELRGAATSFMEGVPLADIDLLVRPGEIVGIAGVAGNGQRELANIILGIQALRSGTKRLFDEDAASWTVARARDRGVGYIPENPMGTSLIAGMTLGENMALSDPGRFSVHGGFGVDWGEVHRALLDAFETLDVDPLPASLRAWELSGGNAQRFAIVRELSRKPKLLVAAYPTKGLDVPTVASVQRLLLAARDKGTGVLLISHDLNELRALSDRMLVMRSGRFVGELDPDTADLYEVGLLMTGGGEKRGDRVLSTG